MKIKSLLALVLSLMLILTAAGGVWAEETAAATEYEDAFTQ